MSDAVLVSKIPVEPLAQRQERRVIAGALAAARDIALPFALTRLILIVITLTAAQWHAAVPDPQRFLSPATSVGGPLLHRWYNWDAAWYLRIAGNGPQMGYSQYTENANHNFGTFAFFPLYPLAVRGVATLIPHALDAVSTGGTVRPELILAGLIVSNVAFALALTALYILVRRRFGLKPARRTLWMLCLFPTSIFFSAPYSESIFFLLLVMFFLFLDLRQWWLAGLCAGLAAATRSLGVALVVPYAAVWWQENQRRRRDTGRFSFVSWFTTGEAAILIPLGLLAYMAYLGLHWGNPLLFRDAEKAWARSFALPWVGIVDGISWSLRGWPHLSQPQWRGLTDAAYAVVFLLLTACAWWKIAWPERLYVVAFWLYVLCEPQISDPNYPDTLISMSRFLLVLLPVWIWLGRAWWRTWLVALPSAALFLVYAARWVNGGWIG